jgi:hypothetical protein
MVKMVAYWRGLDYAEIDIRWAIFGERHLLAARRAKKTRPSIKGLVFYTKQT